jgi:hypothetical protein
MAEAEEGGELGDTGGLLHGVGDGETGMRVM